MLRSLVVGVAAIAAGSVALAAEPITVHKRSLKADGDSFVSQTAAEQWQPSETAIIVCDMWDAHHCLNAVRRESQLAPAMNDMLKQARDRGVLIVHAPSECMAAYAEQPGRKLAQAAPPAANLPAGIASWCKQIPAEEKGVYPIDQTDGGEDDDLQEHQAWHAKLTALGRNAKLPWKRQVAAIEVQDGDAISDSGVEVWNLLEQRGIKNIMLCGVHTNMCVLGRPFGLRQLAQNGKNVVLLRDMTDTMYNPARPPYVNHFQGTELIVHHIEKYVCPTIASSDITGAEPFRFAQDRRHVLMIIGEDEYGTEKTLPTFAESNLKPLGFEVTIVQSDAQDPNDFPGLIDALKQADVVLVSVRRRSPPKEQLDALRAFVAAGKPIVGIRTASHAWSRRNNADPAEVRKQGLDLWEEFDADILGGHYTGHLGAGSTASISIADGAADGAILRGVDVSAVIGHGTLYKVHALAMSAQPLLVAASSGGAPEPVAWTNLTASKSRVFYTSLGHADDFASPAFRKLLTNGIMWTLAPNYVGQDSLDALLPSK